MLPKTFAKIRRKTSLELFQKKKDTKPHKTHTHTKTTREKNCI
jgi:hypothetical protein